MNKVDDLIFELNNIKCLQLFNSSLFGDRYYKLIGTDYDLVVKSDGFMIWFIKKIYINSFEEVFNAVPEEIKFKLMCYINIFNRSK